MVTIRHRDDMSQERIPIEKVADAIKDGMKGWKASS
jgi:glycyl-tRNA synthetase (class II)